MPEYFVLKVLGTAGEATRQINMYAGKGWRVQSLSYDDRAFIVLLVKE